MLRPWRRRQSRRRPQTEPRICQQDRRNLCVPCRPSCNAWVVIPGEVDGVRGDKAKAALGEIARVAKVTLPSDAPNAEGLQAAFGQKGRACPEAPKVIPKPTRRVADQPTGSERLRQVQKDHALQSTSQLCGYRSNRQGLRSIGQQGWFGDSTTYSYSCD